MSRKTRRLTRNVRFDAMDPRDNNERAALRRSYKHLNRATRLAALSLRRLSRSFAELSRTFGTQSQGVRTEDTNA